MHAPATTYSGQPPIGWDSAFLQAAQATTGGFGQYVAANCQCGRFDDYGGIGMAGGPLDAPESVPLGCVYDDTADMYRVKQRTAPRYVPPPQPPRQPLPDTGWLEELLARMGY